MKTEQFGSIKIGTLVKNCQMYDVLHPDKDYGLEQLSIWLSTDDAPFSLEAYKKENADRVILSQAADRLIACELEYDQMHKKAIIAYVSCLKYKKVGQTHVFIYSSVRRTRFRGDYDPLIQMNEKINFNNLISENISVGN